MIRRRGFTLVELNLAMIFVSILLIAVALTTIHVTRIYQKGLTVKTINQIGREVSSQLQRDIAQAVPSEITEFGFGQTKRLCLGEVSYLYNLPGASSPIRDPDGNAIHLVRTQDLDSQWCKLSMSGIPMQLTAGGYSELLTNDVISLAIHDLRLEDYTSSDSRQALYHIEMLLGTNEEHTVDGGTCRPPSDNQANFDYCFVAEFETIVKAGGVSE